MTSFPAGIDTDACLDYILSRQTSEGGFSFYRYAPWGVEEANGVDTWAAVTALGLLAYPAPRRRRVIAWVRTLQYADGGYPTLVIAEAALLTLRLLDARPAQDPSTYLCRQARAAIQDPSGTTRDWPLWLDDARRCARLLRVQGMSWMEWGARILNRLRGLAAPLGAYVTPTPSLIDTWHALDLMRQLHRQADAQTLEFLRLCEQEQLGFVLTPESTATALEVQLAGGQSMRWLDSAPRYAEAIVRFVTGCQAGNGGFARVPGALTGLHDTCRALLVLAGLNPAPGEVMEEADDRGDCGFR